MSTPINGFGLAFPCPFPDAALRGMTLRDWFAGQLICGLADKCGETCTGYMEQRARVAYAFADAMIAERAKGAKP